MNGFKNKPFRKFIDVKILKIDLVHVSRKTQEEIYRKRQAFFITYKDIIKHVFILFYLRELLMSFLMFIKKVQTVSIPCLRCLVQPPKV